MNQNDQQLLNQLQAGDDRAFTQLFSQYRRWLVCMAYSVLEDETEAHDLVQDFFMDCWERKLFCNVHASLKSFLHSAIRNRCLNRLRDEALRKKKLKQLSGSDTELPNRAAAEERALWDTVNGMIRKVAPASAQVFWLTYGSGMNRQEVALQLGISPSTVKHQLARAVRILRGSLELKAVLHAAQL